MGGAYIAVVDDATAVYWNPAGLANLEKPILTTMHSELVGATRYDYVGWGTPVGSGGFGINYLNLSTPGIINTEGSGTDASTSVFYLGYGWGGEKFQVGFTAKYIEEDILALAAGSGWGVDAGMQVKIDDHWRFGLMFQDLLGTELSWDNDTTESIPTNYRVGLAYTRDNLLLCFESERVEDFQLSHFGLEYTLNEFLKLRGGVRGSDLTAGVGISKGPWIFDYAYCAGDLGNTHRLSFGVEFK